MYAGFQMIHVTLASMFLIFTIASSQLIAKETASTGSPESQSSVREMEFVEQEPCPRPTFDRPDALVLAERIIQRDGKELLYDIRQRDDLAEKIDQMLRLIRQDHPEVSRVHARESYAPARLLLQLEPSLIEVINDWLSAQGKTGTLVTGNEKFDTLNSKLGLQGIETFDSIGAVIVCFREGLNVPAAIEAYSMLEGILYAEPDAFLLDGPDIDALKVDEEWYFVFRDAWGDCPSGCIRREFYFFIVKEDGEVRRIDSATSPFRKLMTDKWWTK